MELYITKKQYAGVFRFVAVDRTSMMYYQDDNIKELPMVTPRPITSSFQWGNLEEFYDKLCSVSPGQFTKEAMMKLFPEYVL